MVARVDWDLNSDFSGWCERLGLPLLLAFPVLDRRDSPDHAETAERDLARARVVAEVGGATRSVGKQRQSAPGASKYVCDTGSRRACDHVTLFQRVLLVAQQKSALALEHDEELFLGRVAVRWTGKHAGGDGDVAETGATRTYGAAEIASNATDRLLGGADSVNVPQSGEIAWTQQTRFPHFRSTLSGLEPEGVIDSSRFDPARAEPGNVRARQGGGGVIDVLRESKHIEPYGASLQRVRPHPARKDEAVRLRDVEVDPLLPEKPGAAEDKEDLLGATVNVRRCRPHAGIDLNTRQPGADRAGSRTEPAPARRDVPRLPGLDFNLVPMSEILVFRCLTQGTGRLANAPRRRTYRDPGAANSDENPGPAQAESARAQLGHRSRLSPAPPAPASVQLPAIGDRARSVEVRQALRRDPAPRRGRAWL